MAHFGIITPPVLGHLHPFGALGRELQSRGHTVTVFHISDLQGPVESEGLHFYPMGQSDFPLGSLALSLRNIGRLRGWNALRGLLDSINHTTNMLCRDAPAALGAAGVGALLVDQTEPAGAAIAQKVGLPYITICNALVMNREPYIPPPFVGWSYHENLVAAWRNRVGFWAWDFLRRPMHQIIRRYQRQWGQEPFRWLDDTFSPLAQISQQPPVFDFPRTQLPAHFHYVGPLRRKKTDLGDFPWSRLDGRPLIYASLGTQQGSNLKLFYVMAKACQELPVQLVITHGHSLKEEEVNNLPGRPIVVPYAPQDELLSRAHLTLTHAGLNTVLDSLTHSVPLVAIPITYEQPAIAARIQWSGAGKTQTLAQATPARLRRMIQKVLQDPSFRQQASRIADSIRKSGGVQRAANLIESALSSLAPSS